MPVWPSKVVMNYWLMTGSSKHRVVHALGISQHWIYREPTLMRSCRPNLFTNWGEVVDLFALRKADVQVLTELPWKCRRVHEEKVGTTMCVRVCMREHTPDFKKCMKNTASFFLQHRKKRANGSQNARGKHSSNSVRAKGTDQRESCLRFRPTRQFFPRIPGEGAQREINLRYQFAEFCSIDGKVPGDFTLSAKEPGPVNKIT